MVRFVNLMMAFAILLSGFVTSAPAQTTTGRITGTVSDDSGAVIPGVEIIVRNPSTGLVRNVITNESGTYTVPLLPPAVYEVEASLPGFRPEVRSGVTVQVDAAVRVDFGLKLGDVSDKIEVIADAPLLQSETASFGQVMDSRKVSDIPLNARHFMSLTVLTTGVMPTVQGSNLSSQNMSFHAMGGREHDNNFLYDGVDNNDTGNASLVIVPSVDAIQEFKIQSGAYGAEFGRSSGGVLNVQTKSGTNDFRLVLFEFLRNDVFDARNFYATSKPPYRRNQFGTVFSGPIKRDRTFFMVNYEGNRVRNRVTGLATVPTAKMRAGDFSELSTQLINPVTRQPFPGNIIPAAQMDTIGRNIATFFPDPNRPGLSGNYVSTPRAKTDFDIYTAKVDHRVSDKQNVFVRFTWQDAYQLDPLRGGLLPNTGTAQFQPIGRNVAISDTYVFGPTVVNEFRVGFNRLIGCTCPIWMEKGTKGGDRNFAQELGITGVQSTLRPHPDGRTFGWPIVALTGYAGINQSSGGKRHDNTWHFFDMLAVTRGNHQMKVGGEVRTTMFHYEDGANANGNFTFQGQYTRNAFADLLLGLPSRTQRGIGDVASYTRGRSLSLFFQDDWKITPQLTMNLGVRWEWWTPYVDAVFGQAVFDVPSQQIVIVGKSGPQTFPHPINQGQTITIPGGNDFGRKLLYNQNYKNFVPRVGFAWTPASMDLVVRGGYGIFTVPNINRNGHSFRTSAYPWVIPQTFIANTVTPNITMQDPFPEALGRSSITARAMDPDLGDGYTQQWSLGIQRPLGTNMVVDVSYGGSKGSKWFGSRDINQPLPGPGSVDSRRPIQGWGSIIYDERAYASKFHSLQTKFERRFSAGVTFVSAYTWAHSLTDQDQGSDSSGRLQNAYDKQAEWGDSSFDIRHRLVNSYSFQLPFGAGKPLLRDLSGFANVLLGGWGLAGVTTMSTGQSVTPEVTGDISLTGTNFVRPNRIGNGTLPRGERGPQRWFDTSAFVIPATGTFGNSGRGVLKAPGIHNWDFTLMKTTPIGEDHRIEFRVEFFNALNQANFNIPNMIVNSPEFGTLPQAKDARQIQFGLKLYY